MNAVIKAARTAWATPWTALVGIAIGISVAPGGGFDWAYALWDEVNPVVRMQGVVVDRAPDAVTLHIRGEKLRTCQYLQIRAYAERDDRLYDINHERVDRPEDGHTKPKGVFDIGKWRLWPVAGSTRVAVFTKHSCSGRLVVTKVADVSLVEAAP